MWQEFGGACLHADKSLLRQGLGLGSLPLLLVQQRAAMTMTLPYPMQWMYVAAQPCRLLALVPVTSTIIVL